jgi:glyoxylase-like metal-dependent hydrolase (beta-lactamase superfamily II)
MERREFLKLGASCAAHLALVPPAWRGRFAAVPAGGTAATEPWGRIEQVGPGVWALVSTPLAGGADARRTLANGGIIAGRSGVAIIEGFASEDGAQWMVDMARQLTGRAPTHVVLTHYHGDHAGGLAAYRALAPVFVTTTATRERLSPDGGPAQALQQAELVGYSALALDLGERKLAVTPRAGHTASDLTVAVDDPSVVFGGDLLWNGMFPNYRDATPSVLSESVRDLVRGGGVLVPGHGSVYKSAEATNYVAVLDLIEEAARQAFAAGTPMEVAAREIAIPASLGEWVRFSDRYYVVALQAWERELTAR